VQQVYDVLRCTGGTNHLFTKSLLGVRRKLLCILPLLFNSLESIVNIYFVNKIAFYLLFYNLRMSQHLWVSLGVFGCLWVSLDVFEVSLR
jgi:hypothetical protein